MALIISTPVSNQVFQRNETDRAQIRVSGSIDPAPACVQARLLPAVPDWQPMDYCNASGAYSGEITAPAGGWYTLEVRALDGDGKTVGEASMEKVGVGEVFICAGQSNAANHGDCRLASEEDLVASFDGKAWSKCEDPQRGASGEDGSPWPALGDLLAKHLGLPVAFAAVAVGGTSVSFWQPGQDGYEKLKTVAHVLGVNGARAVLWHQGESDALGAMPAADYERLLANTITSIRSDAGYDIPWFVANVSFVPDHWHESPEQRNAIRSAQQALWKRRIAGQGPDTDTLRDLRFRTEYPIHFSELGLRVHAERWFAALWWQLFEQH